MTKLLRGEVARGDLIAVWFSCGAASAVAAKMTLECYPQATVRILYNPVAEEHPDNLRFLKDVERWLGHPIEFVTHPKYPKASAVEVWDDRQFMSSPQGAPCTRYLKIFARQEWEKENPVDWHVLGFHQGEASRHNQFVLTERSNVLPVLIELGLDKQDCFDFLALEGLRVSQAYFDGLPNGNCLGCVKATSPTYWNLIRAKWPEVFKARAEQSRRIGARLVRVGGVRIFLDELDPAAKGRPLEEYRLDCGTFCEEW